MGYTHYWILKRPVDQKKWNLAMQDCRRIAIAAMRNGIELSGYTAKANKFYGGCKINGKGKYAHEDFTLRADATEQVKQGFEFCKTAQKPYDLVVTACLALLKHRFKNAIEVSSDGRGIDWIDGVNLARRVTRLQVKNPIDPALGVGLLAKKKLRAPKEAKHLWAMVRLYSDGLKGTGHFVVPLSNAHEFTPSEAKRWAKVWFQKNQGENAVLYKLDSEKRGA